MTAPPTRAYPSRRTRLRSILAGNVSTIAAAAVLPLLFGLVLPDAPARVDLEIANPSAYELSVRMSDQHGDSWLAVATIDPGATRTIEDVIDQGETWTFRFVGQARDGGELRVDRAELERADWRLEIPAEVGDRLADDGAPPTP